MQDLQTGDSIYAKQGNVTELIVGRLDDLVFTQQLHESGSKGSVSRATQIEDLVTYGFTKK